MLFIFVHWIHTLQRILNHKISEFGIRLAPPLLFVNQILEKPMHISGADNLQGDLALAIELVKLRILKLEKQKQIATKALELAKKARS